ncbi:MAG TPA: aspartate kinase [bacterium]|nr:aspartate kinase [bacterium]HQL63588.1 aspartate kinase [bacterium]
MALIVQKFGGTSMADPNRICESAKRVKRELDRGNQVVVAVSAMKGETDRLLNLGMAINPRAGADCPREMDMLASTGEQVSIALMAIALNSMGYDSISLTGRQVGVYTDGAFMKAKITNITADRVKRELAEGKVVVVAGFQGMDPNDDVTTMGRGASDLTAVAISAALKADRCDIYTDVDGVYAADPRIVPQAKKLPVISYEEMLEMASAGAKVLHTRAVELAAKYNVKVKVLSSFDELPEDITVDLPGTIITSEPDSIREDVLVSSIQRTTNEAKVTLVDVADRPGTAAKIFQLLADYSVVVDMIVQNVGAGGKADLSFTVERPDLVRIKKIEDQIKELVGAQDVLYDDKISKISAIGVGMRTHAGVAARMFDALGKRGINIMMISTSEIKISVVIGEEYTELAVRTLCDEFHLTESTN